jgi:hypothetical protein
MKVLKNYPFDHEIKDSILIKEDSPEWDEAYSSWLSGKNPTNDPRWKSGVFLGFEEKE